MPAHGPWSPTYQSIWTHRKTFELAALLGLNETYAAAHVIRLCTWAIDNAPDGDLSGLSDRAIAYGAGWAQEVSLFVGALMKSGYLDEDRVIHDWHHYAGRLIERRREDADRKQKSRGHAPDVPRTSNGASGLVRRREEDTTVQDTRTEGTTVPSPQPPPRSAAEGERPSRRRRGSAAVLDDVAAPAEPEALTDPTDVDRWLWGEALGILTPGLLPANAAKLDALEVLGRGQDGGLRLRAPPGSVDAMHWKRTVAAALSDAGDEHGQAVAIVEG